MRIIRMEPGCEMVEIVPPQEAIADGGYLFFKEQVGGWLEQVRLPRYRKDVALIIDEEGRLKHLELNPPASLLHGWLTHGQTIHGIAFLVGLHDDPEDGPLSVWGSLPDDVTIESVIEHMKKMAKAS